MKPKDKKIIEDAEKFGTPIFVLVAKDKLATQAIMKYLDLCIQNNCNEKHIMAAVHRLEEFQAYKTEFPDNIKLPD